jgi:hypothetical protein
MGYEYSGYTVVDIVDYCKYFEQIIMISITLLTVNNTSLLTDDEYLLPQRLDFFFYADITTLFITLALISNLV